MKKYHSSGVNIAMRIFLCGAAALLGACGGGGGGGSDFVGAANVTIDATPAEVDSGDEVFIEVRIDDVHENGIALKVSCPDALAYRAGSAELIIDPETTSIEPTNNETAEGRTYLVFYLRHGSFVDGDNKKDGILTLRLTAKKEVENGRIEVDADVDDPTVANTTEFNVASPAFDPQDDVNITVKG